MSNGAFEIHAHTHHLQWTTGNLVLLLYNKADRGGAVNYKLYILVSGDVHRLQFDRKTKKQRINNLCVYYITV